jgi:NTE family protein
MQEFDFVQDHVAATLRRLVPALVSGAQSAELLAAAARWFSTPGGNVVFRKSDPSTTVFIVICGLVAVVTNGPDGGERIISRLGPGEVFGEMGCITGQPRTATVRAVRSSEILEIDLNDVQRISAQDPGILLWICRTLVNRLALAQDGRSKTFQPSTFAIITAGDGADEQQFAESFKEALTTYGTSFLMTSAAGRVTTTEGLNRVEKEHKYVVYLTDKENPSWTNRCIGQADMLLVVARGGQPPQPLDKTGIVIGPDIPIVLILEWALHVQPHNSAEWIRATGASRHYHVRSVAHVRRVARLLTGNGFGLVLSGGGARGLAHIGVGQALKENGIEIDVVMGTSIGALIGSGIALEWDKEFMHEKIRQFVSLSPLWDVGIPRTSILAGRNIRRSLNRWFGELRIEDMPTPYACISTNLSAGVLAVHKSGDLKTWVTASAALPGIFPPVEVEGQLHVDGGVLNNMPADKIREAGASFVLGIDVGADAVPASDSPNSLDTNLNLLELLVRVGSIGDGALASTRRKHCDVLIIPNVRSVGLLNFKAYEQAIEAGFSATVERMAEISKAMPLPPSPEAMAGRFL